MPLSVCRNRVVPGCLAYLPGSKPGNQNGHILLKNVSKSPKDIPFFRDKRDRFRRFQAEKCPDSFNVPRIIPACGPAHRFQDFLYFAAVHHPFKLMYIYEIDFSSIFLPSSLPFWYDPHLSAAVCLFHQEDRAFSLSFPTAPALSPSGRMKRVCSGTSRFDGYTITDEYPWACRVFPVCFFASAGKCEGQKPCPPESLNASSMAHPAG